MSFGLFTDAETKPTIEWFSVPAGTFALSSPESKVEWNNNETQHQITLSAFMMSKYEVTL